ncbi:hypothetical protein [Rhizobium rhizogenes]|uniref:hypothetical protein n=1 Tax=Rhizobium rhizogenes TaxID=359 RepID=UPI0015742404|nr:hypothetical protein [Rhizobium rhizogenes]NTH18467.1 hypothetical protein [Rhizobium rhizogenes]NTH31441.1 hypothetical protein [Rhizobium rhizogenes]
MLVYRIEHENGQGAFDAGLARLHDDHTSLGVSAYDHPAPRSYGEQGTPLARLFGYSDEQQNYYFGCRSKPQLRMWFRSEAGRRAMAAEGGMMVTYDVPEEHLARGRYQVAFRKDHATQVSAVPADQW